MFHRGEEGFEFSSDQNLSMAEGRGREGRVEGVGFHFEFSSSSDPSMEVNLP